MTDAISRLRASRQNFVNGETARGRTWGIEWAMLHAEYNELLQLAKIDWDPEGDNGIRYALDVYGWIIDRDYVGLGDLDQNDLEKICSLFNFNTETTEILRITPDYICGFIEGASSVWYEVKNEL